MLLRTIASASVAASILAADVVLLTLFLNPEATLRRDGAALVVSLLLPCLVLGAAGFALLALVGAAFRGWPRAPRPPLPGLPGFVSLSFLALAAAAGLFWLNLFSYRHSVPAESLRGLAASAAAEHPGLRVCLELHPGTCVFNVETFGRVATLGPSIGANLDPSHFFWMGMDGHRVAAALGGRVGHVHGKDTVFHPDSLALNGLLDRRWPEPAADMPWTFAVPGRGHGLAWWAGLVRALSRSEAEVVSIEHEDPFVPAETGVPEAARLLRAAIDAAGDVAG